jgi:hypothetical protein
MWRRMSLGVVPYVPTVREGEETSPSEVSSAALREDQYFESGT